MEWWLWVLLIGFGLVALTVVMECLAGSWIGSAIKEGLDRWSEF